MAKNSIAEEEEEDDELEPLFSYQRVCRPPADDDSDDDVTVLNQKGVGKRTTWQAWPSTAGSDEIAKEIEDDEDWLPPPPKHAKILDENKVNEDPTLREIRQAREELMRLAESRIQDGNNGHNPVSQMPEFTGEGKEGNDDAAHNREKVLLTILKKDGDCKSLRLFKDEKFGKLFSKYAELIGLPHQQMVFFFDGQKILEDNTPKDFDMEDEDIIEANFKSDTYAPP